MLPRILLPLLVFAILLGSAAARADEADKRVAALFDHPAASRKVPAKSDADEGNELRCTYYPDLMIREIGTDTPAPGAATILPLHQTTLRPACSAQHAAGEIVLKTENYSLVGRKGPFVLFEATDPNGAVPFILIAAATGKVIYTDSMGEDGLKAISAAGTGLRLRFTRGVNASCSLVKDGAACWTRMVTEGTIPASIGQLPAPLAACAAAYKKDRVPAEDPSIVLYDVDMTVDISGAAQMNAHGTLGCAALP